MPDRWCCSLRCSGFGVIAALFGPIKYGIFPDHLRREQLPTANALIEAATFIAILTGTIAGGLATGARRRDRDCSRSSWLSRCVLGIGIVHPADRLGRAAPENPGQYRRFHRGDDAVSARGSEVVVGRDGDQLVLARRHRGAVAAAADDQQTGWRRRRNGDRLSRDLLDCGRHRLGPCGGIARGRIVLRTTLIGAVLLGVFALDLGVC